MVKSRVAENGRQIKRGNKKKKRKVLKIFLFVNSRNEGLCESDNANDLYFLKKERAIYDGNSWNK